MYRHTFHNLPTGVLPASFDTQAVPNEKGVRLEAFAQNEEVRGNTCH